jgi:hypothetical protein
MALLTVTTQGLATTSCLGKCKALHLHVMLPALPLALRHVVSNGIMFCLQHSMLATLHWDSTVPAATECKRKRAWGGIQCNLYSPIRVCRWCSVVGGFGVGGHRGCVLCGELGQGLLVSVLLQRVSGRAVAFARNCLALLDISCYAAWSVASSSKCGHLIMQEYLATLLLVHSLIKHCSLSWLA